MNLIKSSMIAFVSVFLFFSCTDGDPDLCDNSSSDFQTLFQDLIHNGHTDAVSFDTEIHEYTFMLASDQEICKIGYRSQPDIASIPYQIEIIDNSSNVTIYADSHVFSSSETSYVIPSSTINLQSGVSYTIKRIQTNWDKYISNTIGRVARNSQMSFPYNKGEMTITESRFHQNGGPLTDIGVPYIDLLFK